MHNLTAQVVTLARRLAKFTSCPHILFSDDAIPRNPFSRLSTGGPDQVFLFSPQQVSLRPSLAISKNNMTISTSLRHKCKFKALGHDLRKITILYDKRLVFKFCQDSHITWSVSTSAKAVSHGNSLTSRCVPPPRSTVWHPSAKHPIRSNQTCVINLQLRHLHLENHADQSSTDWSVRLESIPGT